MFVHLCCLHSPVSEQIYPNPSGECPLVASARSNSFCCNMRARKLVRAHASEKKKETPTTTNQKSSLSAYQSQPLKPKFGFCSLNSGAYCKHMFSCFRNCKTNKRRNCLSQKGNLPKGPRLREVLLFADKEPDCKVKSQLSCEETVWVPCQWGRLREHQFPGNCPAWLLEALWSLPDSGTLGPRNRPARPLPHVCGVACLWFASV